MWSWGSSRMSEPVPDRRDENGNLPVLCRLHGGPHDGDRMVLPWARLRIDLSLWEGPFITDCYLVGYRLRSRWNGGIEADYDFDDPEPEFAAPEPTFVPVQRSISRSNNRRRAMVGVLALVVLAAVRYRERLIARWMEYRAFSEDFRTWQR